MILDRYGVPVPREPMRRALGFVEAYVRDEPQDQLSVGEPSPRDDGYVPEFAQHWFEASAKRSPL